MTCWHRLRGSPPPSECHLQRNWNSQLTEDPAWGERVGTAAERERGGETQERKNAGITLKKSIQGERSPEIKVIIKFQTSK